MPAFPKPKLPGLFKGLGVTLNELKKTATEGAATVQYPHVKEAPPMRARGVIALREDNCTSCMLCARSCPDWCIYIEGHKELAPPRRAGGKPRSGQQARPVRHRLRAVHVLRHLRRGLPVRRAVLEPRVRVLRAAHRRPAPRQGRSSASGWRPSPRLRSSKPAPTRRGRSDALGALVAQNIGFGVIAALMIVGALRVVTTNNVVHAALWLVVVLAGAAAQYVCSPPSSSPSPRCWSTSGR